MVDIKKNIDPQCWMCKHWTMPVPDPPFCNHWKRTFPHHDAWRKYFKGDPRWKEAPALRSCKHWE